MANSGQRVAHVSGHDNRDRQDSGNDSRRPKEKTAGLKNPDKPDRKEVTTVCPSVAHDSATPPSDASAPAQTPPSPPADKSEESVFIDFAHLKRQLPIGRVLDQLGIAGRLRGTGPQKRCTCPIHRGDARGRTSIKASASASTRPAARRAT